MNKVAACFFKSSNQLLIKIKNKQIMNNGSTIVSVGKSETLSLFNQIDAEFQEMNDRQSKIISSIQEKLHSVINKTNEVGSSNNQLDPQIPISLDFQSSIKNKLADLMANTNRLTQVLSHLNEIV